MAYSNSNSSGSDEHFSRVIEAIEDDLDTHKALDIWSENVNSLNRDQFEKLFTVFGLIYKEIEKNPEVAKLAEERQQAREKMDFLTADNRRKEIEQMGYEVVDGPTATTYVPR